MKVAVFNVAKNICNIILAAVASQLHVCLLRVLLVIIVQCIIISTATLYNGVKQECLLVLCINTCH